MKKNKFLSKVSALLFLLLQCFCTPIQAQLNWPSGQLLPSFPATANTVDLIYLNKNTAEELYLFSSLKGIVNRTQPRIFAYDGDAFAEGAYTWMQSLGLKWVEHSNCWNMVSKYRNEISGLIVYDPAQIHTVNLATVLAKDRKAIIAAPSLLSKLTSAPYNLPILLDLRGQFTSKMEVYQTLFDTYWPSLDHRLIIGLNPEVHKASLREYATALGAATVWLDPKDSVESKMLDKFLASMPVGANHMGWWPEEGAGIQKVSAYGITTIASDWCTNLTVHSGMPRTINIKPAPPKPALQKKIYVAFILSDGDNLQYVEHLLRKLWSNKDRGTVPLGWTMSPAMVDAMPGALNYYHQTATDNDNLISGPSGYGYTYPNFWTDQNALNQFVIKTEEYNRRAGFRVITIWNTITGGINSNVGQAFATYAPTLLGLTGQNTGGLLSIYKTLPGMPLSCNYGTSEQAMKDHITSASAGWDGLKPRFVIIQCQPWTALTPTNFKNVAESLGSNYEVVRPDHLFELMRESKGLPINPSGILGNGDGLTGSYFNDMLQKTLALTRRDITVNFDWGSNAPASEIKTDGFSVKWTGQIQSEYSESHTFYTTSTGGVKLTIDGNVLIDALSDSEVSTKSNTITLQAGRKYNISLEYVHVTGNALCKLEWQSASLTKQMVPKSQLYPESISPVSTTGVVTIYTGSGFGGFSLGLKMGDYTSSDLRTLNIFEKEIASIRIQKGYRVKLFALNDFKGEFVEISSDSIDLGNWKNKTLSLKVMPNKFTTVSGTFLLKNKSTGFFMEAGTSINATADGFTLRQDTLTSLTNQQFQLTPLEDGSYQILVKHSDKSLDVKDKSPTSGAMVLQYGYLGLPSQKFILMPTNDGYYKIMFAHSGKILESASIRQYGSLRQMNDSSQILGQWQFLPLTAGAVGTGTGLTAKYYNGMNFEIYKATKTDTTINFNWGQGSPTNTNLNPDGFSIRWTGDILPSFTGPYTFFITSDNGRKLWINNTPIIDKWLDDHGIEYSGIIDLTAGVRYPIQIDYFESVGGANIKLEWMNSFQGKQLIPKSQLYPESASSMSNPNFDNQWVSMYPNMVSNGRLNVAFSNLSERLNAHFTLYDLRGKFLRKEILHDSGTVDIHGICSGIYLATIRTENKTYNQKILVQ